LRLNQLVKEGRGLSPSGSLKYRGFPPECYVYVGKSAEDAGFVFNCAVGMVRSGFRGHVG
jgi:hypothetical protein